LSSTTSRAREETSRPRERGQVLVLFAGALLVLLLICALAFDVGMLFVERRDQQNAADAAALAGARYVLVDPVAAEDAARRLARVNGYDDADPNETVHVFIPAIHGRYAGLPGFIEVQIEATRPSIFGGVIGKANWPVGAFAVATNDQDLTFPFSMMALNPSACKAIAISGGGLIEAYANIQSNSNGTACVGDTIGFSRTGGSTVSVFADDATCRVVGRFQDGGSGPPLTCDVAQNSFALPDPLRNLSAPAKPPLAAPMVYAGTTSPAPAIPKFCPGASAPQVPNEASPSLCKIPASGGSANDPWILYPGLYPGGIAVSQDRTVYLMPGIYWIGGGGLDIGGGASIVTIATEADALPSVATAPCATATTLETLCGGVLIYNSKLPAAPGGAFVLNSNGAAMKIASLNLPTTDPNHIYNDMVIFQDRTVTTPVTLNGSASSTMAEGVIYVPGGQIKLNGNGGTLIVDQVIADTFDINGGGGTIKVLHGKGIDAIITAAGLVD
jgi:Flp pilus assembly protein TadG